MPAIGRGTRDEMVAADYTKYNRWIVPATEREPRKYYALLVNIAGDVVLNESGGPSWYLREGRILEESDPIITAAGVVQLGDLLTLLNTDYRAIVGAGL